MKKTFIAKLEFTGQSYGKRGRKTKKAVLIFPKSLMNIKKILIFAANQTNNRSGKYGF